MLRLQKKSPLEIGERNTQDQTAVNDTSIPPKTVGLTYWILKQSERGTLNSVNLKAKSFIDNSVRLARFWAKFCPILLDLRK